MSQRLISLDFFRGFTIAAMIVVNDPGSWTHVFGPLRHASWHGATPTDLVFPFFLFIVGVSIVLSLSKIKTGNKYVYLKILKRTLILFGIGIFLAVFPNFDFSNVRIAGVLQRIALVYFFCSIIYLNSNKMQQVWMGVFCLLIYWIFMKHVPFGDSVAGILEPGNNFAAWIDRFITPGRMYQKTWDPEGFFSTIPAIATGISGMCCGHLILSKSKSLKDKIILMYFFGSICLCLGLLWDYSFPINKHIWTSSYVLLSSGLGMLFLASCIWIIDHKKFTFNTRFGIVFGSNAIFAYALHSMLGRVFRIPIINGNGIQKTWMDFGLSTEIDPQIFSLIWALFYTFLIYLIVNEMYKRKIFIKI
jgi:predicted acyltransferase